MKLKFIPTLVSLVAAALLAYMFYTIARGKESMLMPLVVSGFFSLVLCLECGIGISWGDSRHQVDAFAVSAFFFLVFVAEHCCFAYWGTSAAWVFITTGLLALFYLLIIYGITKAKM